MDRTILATACRQTFVLLVCFFLIAISRLLSRPGLPCFSSVSEVRVREDFAGCARCAPHGRGPLAIHRRVCKERWKPLRRLHNSRFDRKICLFGVVDLKSFSQLVYERRKTQLFFGLEKKQTAKGKEVLTHVFREPIMAPQL